MNSHESKFIQAAKAAKKRDIAIVIQAAKAAKKRDIAIARDINKLLRKLAAQPEPYLRLVTVNGERV